MHVVVYSYSAPDLMPSIYLDHAATTPLDPEVFDAMVPYLRDHYGNASSVHQMGRKARFAVEEAREQVADCLGAEPGEIVFTSGGTESDNAALKGALSVRESEARTRLVTSAAEHEAVLRPAERLQNQGADVCILTPQAHGAVTPEQVAEAIDASTALVSLMHANNEIGTLTDIEAIADVCHDQDVWLHCDAVQTAGLFDLDVHELGVDLLSVSGHKFYGPKGVGVLFVSNQVELGPLVEGGSQERKRRGGTENVAGVVGLATALQKAVDAADRRSQHLRTLQQRLVEGLDRAIPGDYRLNTPLGSHPTAPHVVNIAFPADEDGQASVDGEMLILNLDMKGVLVSAGSACTSGALEPSHVLEAIGLDRTTASTAVRFSFGTDNTAEEVDSVLETLEETLTRMRS